MKNITCNSSSTSPIESTIRSIHAGSRAVKLDITQHNDNFIISKEIFASDSVANGSNSLIRALKLLPDDILIMLNIISIHNVTQLSKLIQATAEENGIKLNNILITSHNHSVIKSLKLIETGTKYGLNDQCLNWATLELAKTFCYSVTIDENYIDEQTLAAAKSNNIRVFIETQKRNSSKALPCTNAFKIIHENNIK